ncbi:MAG: hypothetical protein CL946_10930 [Ectothiorhodospiraceae bacterium]|nr:hypothetical protein [Ectothiorhodospiraceae bacterium]
MTSDIAPYLFPVAEYPVSIGQTNRPTSDYKAIVRQDNGKLISIQRKTYKLVPNSEVIKPLLAQLHKLDTSWYIDTSHSFVESEKMRLQVTFPELIFHDGRSDIALSLFIHNSYDSSEGIRMMFGAIRGICKNGMVFGEVLSKFYGKHTQGFDVRNLRQVLESTYDKIPVIKHRIEAMQNTRPSNELRADIQKKIGKKAMNYVEQQESESRKAQNEWILYNFLTYFISHIVQQRMRAHYQLQVSKLFKL